MTNGIAQKKILESSRIFASKAIYCLAEWRNILLAGQTCKDKHTSLFILHNDAKKARACLFGKFLHSSIIFVNKIRACPSVAPCGNIVLAGKTCIDKQSSLFIFYTDSGLQ